MRESFFFLFIQCLNYFIQIIIYKRLKHVKLKQVERENLEASKKYTVCFTCILHIL